MRDTPIHLNGPFTLALEQEVRWVIRGRDGVPICELSTKLIDGSSRIDRYPDGFIRSAQAREEEAKFVLDALNAVATATFTSPFGVFSYEVKEEIGKQVRKRRGEE